MRIQHNIMAMSAYRNYNTNTSALAKNLEKLSSGYKINRAGDDAAGLAISEKMRAQITGLEAAQKNVKDGISLVKTAEGAMQEIQDMLNRMDYLATQSANGTYQDEVDRENLNKEMEALKTEINRIADSANFNGIKLLDGSLDTNKVAVEEVTENQTVDPTKTEALTFENGKLAAVGNTLGVDTVLHNNALTDGGTEFSVDFHNFTFDASAEGNTMTVKVGDSEIKLTATGNAGELSGSSLVNAILGKNANISVEVSGDGNEGLSGANGMKINGQEFEVKADSTLDYRLTFAQKNAPATEAEEIDGSMEVSISGEVKANVAKYTFDSTDLGTETIGGILSINGETYQIGDDGSGTAETWADVFGNIAKQGPIGGFNVEIDANGVVTMTATETGKKSEPTITYTPTDDKTNTLTQKTAGTAGTAATVAGGAATTAQLKTGEIFKFNGITVNPLFATGTAISTARDILDADGNKTGYQYTIAGTGEVTITATAGAGADANGTVTVSIGDSVKEFTFSGGVSGAKDAVTYDVTGWNTSKLGDLTLKFAAGDVELNYDDLVAAGEDGVKVGSTGYIATLDGNTLTLTAESGGTVGGTGPAARPNAAAEFKVYDTGSETTNDDITFTTVSKGAEGGELQGVTTGAHGDFNVSTTAIKNVSAGGVDRLASTYFDLTEDMVREGSVLTIAGVDYTFTTDKSTTNGVDISSGDLATIAKNLTDAARSNTVYTVGHDGSRISLTETLAHNDLYVDDGNGNITPPSDYDLRTKEGIEKSLGFKGVAYQKEVVTTEGEDAGKALNLQIGETSDDFNQMKVSIGDMHVSAMKYTDEETGETTSVDDIDILTSDHAQAAVDVIKNAINYVSSIRGDLGAYQNRLEHTANNLSVMAENIQDAESTIRDTDIAEEMMSYTKNNILVQSAQAMLAQANAVPQGVLQLLG